jgi:hypothetical protein
MRTVTRIFEWLYAQSLKLYPSGFREEFEEEMTAVFAQSMTEAIARGRRAATVVALREFHDLPLNLTREHWHSLTKRELPMTAIHKKPEWFFYPGWLVLSTLAVPIAIGVYQGIISLITQQVGDMMQVGAQMRVTEDYLFPFIFIPILCLLTGLLQYSLLRRYLPRMGWWVLATALGWALAFEVSEWTYSLLGHESKWMPALIFPLVGASIGLAQWFVLRRRLPQAGWWLAANVLSWGLVSVPARDSLTNFLEIVYIGLLPAIITGYALRFLLNQQFNRILRRSEGNGH